MFLEMRYEQMRRPELVSIIKIGHESFCVGPADLTVLHPRLGLPPGGFA